MECKFRADRVEFLFHDEIKDVKPIRFTSEIPDSRALIVAVDRAKELSATQSKDVIDHLVPRGSGCPLSSDSSSTNFYGGFARAKDTGLGGTFSIWNTGGICTDLPRLQSLKKFLDLNCSSFIEE